MKTLHFETTIDAPRADVWDVMLRDETYRIWASAFMEGSYYEGTWDKGSRILFMAPDGSSAMISEIAESRPHEFLSLRHLGMMKDGVEDTESPEVRKWAPAYENYTFEDHAGGTRLSIDLDMPSEWEEMMNESWPKALEKLREICET
jgi:uncharacterized protein YndB with AHSA1/START domain